MQAVAEGLGEALLGRFVELFTGGGEIEDIDDDLAFRIDKGDFDVAVAGGEAEGDLAQEAAGVLGDDLQKGAVGGSFVVKFEAGGDADAGPGQLVIARGEQLLDGDAVREGIADAVLEAVDFGVVQLEGAVGIGELEGVDDNAGGVGESVRLNDVHAPGGEDARHIGEEPGTVLGDESDLVELADGAEGDLNRVGLQVLRHAEMRGDLFGSARGEIALRQALEESAELVDL